MNFVPLSGNSAKTIKPNLQLWIVWNKGNSLYLINKQL